jgi:FixJ family two-component response regulator
MANGTPVVYVVDSDPETRNSLTQIVQAMGLLAESYPSAEAYLDEYRDTGDSPRCIVLADRLPGLSGLGLQRMLAANGTHIPIIMISDRADIPTVVAALRTGATDFLEKPINGQILTVRIREAIDQFVRQKRDAGHKTELYGKLEKLSARQREVLDLLVVGERTKQIARQLGIGEKTVAKHRATVLEKMQVDSVVELVHLFSDAKPAIAMDQQLILQCN